MDGGTMNQPAMNYKALETKLRRIVEKRLEEGWYLAPGRFYTETGGCCVVGVVATDTVSFSGWDGVISSNDPSFFFEKEFAIDRCSGIVASLMAGFDGVPSSLSVRDKAAYAVGEHIRRIYCDGNGVVE
jgi:hypothetical protein